MNSLKLSFGLLALTSMFSSAHAGIFTTKCRPIQVLTADERVTMHISAPWGYIFENDVWTITLYNIGHKGVDEGAYDRTVFHFIKGSCEQGCRNHFVVKNNDGSRVDILEGEEEFPIIIVEGKKMRKVEYTYISASGVESETRILGCERSVDEVL